MRKVEVFFDYNCQSCFKGYEQLIELLRNKPRVEIVWHPCEIRVFKNEPGRTDISLQGMYFAAESNLDLWRYHEKVFDMVSRELYNNNIDSFVEAFDGFLNVEAFRRALKSGRYIERLKKSNHYSFKITGVHVVPTYRIDGGYLQDRQEFYGLGPSDTAYGGSK